MIAILALSAVSFAALMATLIFRKKLSGEFAHVAVGFIPLELCVLLFSTPFWCVALMILCEVA